MIPLDWHGQLSHIALRVEDPERASRFYEDVVGLTEHTDAADGARHLGWGLGEHVLELREGVPSLDHFGLEIADDAEREALLERLTAGGVVVDAREAADGASRHVIADPEGRIIHLRGRMDRAGERVGDIGRRPLRLQHITFATPSVAALSAFYADVLGLRVSDRMGERFTWLRCGLEHHTVAMVQVDDAAPGLDHFSFDLGGWADFRDWCDRLTVAGVPVGWGPGRHGPGNNLFIMFDDLDANHVELSAEMELYHDDTALYTPRVWAEATKTTNLWGSAPSWRKPLPVA